MTALDRLRVKLDEWKAEAEESSNAAGKVGAAYHRGEKFAYGRVADWVDLLEEAFDAVEGRR